MITGSIEVEGIRADGNNFNNIRYADDTVLLARIEKNSQNLLNVMNERGQKFTMEMNSKKIKVLVIQRNQNVQANITFNSKTLEHGYVFKYLGSTITENGRSQREVLIRVAEAKQAFQKMKSSS